MFIPSDLKIIAYDLRKKLSTFLALKNQLIRDQKELYSIERTIQLEILNGFIREIETHLESLPYLYPSKTALESSL